ncbi:UvrD-helicase domain-containing protein [uncultured Brevundimonas sp.]|uniref:UvrD-helicase domain-containing protein n=1 Tax=uncultured Brevundimonas sp. TaxID=213418 RepID=UPI0030ED41C3|tara:strand:+ start:10875 stop:14282 length:3408 start_codon:yes stop_codon:yes gene_type:complete
MTDTVQGLRDDEARRTAITIHDRSILVEAGAGSGKTAVMAGRIAAMLAEGTPPASIAAVTFTELAASELLVRVRDVVSELAAGHVPAELRIAYPGGLSETQRGHLALAYMAIGDLTCSTIHGFCQRLIKPYPVEADIDPGAAILDRNQGDLAFVEIVDSWLRHQLSGGEGGLLADLVLHSPGETVALVHKIADNLRRRRTVSAPAVSPLAPLVLAFRQAVDDLATFLAGAPAVEAETADQSVRFGELADAIDDATVETPAGLVRLLVLKPHRDLTTATGAFSAYRKKGKWADAAKRQGLSKAEGDRLNLEAGGHYDACCKAWSEMTEVVASRVLADLIRQVQPVLRRFREYKRSTALLDFDDLIFAARDLLRDHDDVRRALALRFSRVLVDEFQDTDPMQTEIFWRLCGEPPSGVTGDAASDWAAFHIRPGALFLVGDPKQAIYRFRGADVAAYVRARQAFAARDGDSVLSISTNFRSCAPILAYVNSRFEAVLSSDGQPGFTALDAFHPDRGEAVCVAALDVAAADADGKASPDVQRDAEAEAVAEMCARLIGSEMILDRRSGDSRVCRPGDVALLAPTGSELWRYEEALERRGIPVATQAGKGFFKRQEIQDLIAITRVLSDRRDTLALVALLRGPLVGLTEEALLDIVWALARPEDRPEDVGKLDLGVEAAGIAHALARRVIETLQALQRRVHSTTPHDLLSQAVDALRVRPLLLQRHQGQAERALANVDLYLSMTAGFAVRGLRAFSETMTAAWTDEARAVEGRPDAQEEAVALYTMHAAKGLEWPIVVPINTMTRIMAAENAVTDRGTDVFYCPVLGVKPAGFDAVREAEKDELDRERIRLWYVASTRARELLVLPRLDVAPVKTAWIGLLDLSLADLPALDLAHLSPEPGEGRSGQPNTQTREVFASEASRIVDGQVALRWLAPSRDEGGDGPLLTPEIAEIWAASDTSQPDEDIPSPAVQGGRERGLVLHKLLEEVLTGETADDAEALVSRARDLIIAIGQSPVEDAATGLSATELAGCVSRTLALPEIVALRPTLIPEFPVYAAMHDEDGEKVTVGVTDATSFGADGQAEVVIDWKSDVRPTPETLDHYNRQVRNYLDMTGTPRGLIVLVTSGQIITVSSSPRPSAF